MANRQYIGARYVPKFADPVEWNSALSYEALTIVTHLGNSFTSKKPVPAGVDIANGEYWVNTGNYNEQIDTYRAEVAELSADVKNVKKRYYVFIGDSYLSGVGANGQGWLYHLANDLKLTQNVDYWTPSENLSGYGFASRTDQTIRTWTDALTDLASTMTNKDAITDVIVAGGYNDAFAANADAIVSGMRQFNTVCKNNFPNATVSLAFIAHYANTTYVLPGINMAYTTYTKCGDLGWAYFADIDNLIKDTNYYAGDDAHLNSAGYKAIADGLANYLRGGNTKYLSGVNAVAVNENDSWSVSPSNAFYEWVFGNRWGLRYASYEQLVFTAKAGKVLTGVQGLCSFVLYHYEWQGNMTVNREVHKYWNVCVYATTASGTVALPAVLCINYGSLWINAKWPNEAVTSITMYGLDLECSTLAL